MLSVLAGQESGWDFLNYHVYNAYSFLGDRLNQDLSPAGFQSYFNPMIDLPYYWMIGQLPAVLVGFVMGFFQGLVFIPVLGISLLLVERMNVERSMAMLVAIAGVFSAGFIDQIRGVSGDNIVALFQLSAMYLVVSNLVDIKQFKKKALIVLIVAGVISGIGSGLKLTSATASLAICFSLLFVSQSFHHRIYSAFVFSMGVLIGLSMSAGYWFYEMYSTFGNPLFPQFGTLFPSSLATSVAIADTSALPQSVVDVIIRPFVFLFDPERLHGEDWPQIIWPIFYVVCLMWLVNVAIKRRCVNEARDELHEDRIKIVVAYVVFGFIFWMMLFSIYRYQLYFFMLAPLAILVMVGQMGGTRFNKALAWFFLASIFLSLVTSLRTMGSNGWADRSIWSDLSQFDLPIDSSILFVGEPMAWISVLLPKEVSIVGIGNNFPASQGHKEKVLSIIRERTNLFAALPIRENGRLASVNLANSFVENSIFTGTKAGCDAIKWVLAHSKIRATYIEQPGGNESLCRLGVREKDVQSYNNDAAALLKQQKNVLAQYGYSLDKASCQINYGYVGNKKFEFNVCKLK